MEWTRQLPEADYNRIKTAWRTLVRACGGPEKVSKITRARNPSLICEYGQPHCADRFPPLDVVMDLEAECGQPIVTRVLADFLGFDLVPREPAAKTQATEDLVGESLQQDATFTADFIKADADGALSEREKERLREKNAAIITTRMKLDDALRPDRKLRVVG